MREQVHHVSALRLLESIDDRCAGAIILDPPTHIGVGGSDDETQVDEMIAILAPIADQVHRILRPGGASIMLGEPQIVSAWEVASAWAELRLIAEMVVLWDHDKGSETLASLTTAVRWHVRPGRRYSFWPSGPRVDSNVIICRQIPIGDRLCPTQRPVELFNYLLTLLTDPGDLVIDPFCGAGSALVSASMCGRPWIGGDIDESMCEAARTRVQQVDIESSYLRPLHLWTSSKLLPMEG
jgi:site-specific DNA-methyltransferase (adenine-specific)